MKEVQAPSFINWRQLQLTVILHYEETRFDGQTERVVIRSGRCLSHQGETVPWFAITRRFFLAAVTSLCREIAQREAFVRQA